MIKYVYMSELHGVPLPPFTELDMNGNKYHRRTNFIGFYGGVVAVDHEVELPSDCQLNSNEATTLALTGVGMVQSEVRRVMEITTDRAERLLNNACAKLQAAGIQRRAVAVRKALETGVFRVMKPIIQNYTPFPTKALQTVDETSKGSTMIDVATRRKVHAGSVRDGLRAVRERRSLQSLPAAVLYCWLGGQLPLEEDRKT